MTQEEEIEKDSEVILQGWIRTSRFSKNVTFIHLYDGNLKFGQKDTIQIVVSPAVSNETKQQLGAGTAIQVRGKFVESKGSEQDFELKCTEEQIEIIGECNPSEFPVQKKDASKEFYRTIPHLRIRTEEFQRIFKARSFISMAIHQFFAKNGFMWIHTPIITGSDCEGAGEMFKVATSEHIPEKGIKVTNTKKFFGKDANLTVSGQLEVEPFACAFSKVYTFGPTFRAENSHTSRHASEFWMVEPEIAFASLSDVMDLAEHFVMYLIHQSERILHSPLDVGFKWGDSFPRITYTEAQEILAASGRDFEYPIGWGESLQAEHERYLAEEHFGKPVFVTHYPIEQKPFYMRVTDDCEPDWQTVECFDLLVPGVGEIIGGSAREERTDKLLEQMERFGIDPEEYKWYLDLRKFGSVPHGGFGLGFERILMWILGVENIRDVIPYPRTPGNMV